MKSILEKISLDQTRSFTFYEYQTPRFDCPFHHHPEIELTLIRSSCGHRYVGDHIGRFDPGDFVLMGPDLPHTYLNDATFPGKAHSVVLQFLPECFGAGFFQLAEMKGVLNLLQRSRLGLTFHGPKRDEAIEAFIQLTRLQGTDRLSSVLKILQMLAEKKDYRTLASPTYSPALALYQGERINRVCELISRKFQDNLTQSDASRVARMSPPSFSRFFRRATNRTFRAFLNEVRVGHASRMLLESDKTVAEICYESGFGNLSNFNRQFLKLRKISPRDYRQERRLG